MVIVMAFLQSNPPVTAPIPLLFIFPETHDHGAPWAVNKKVQKHHRAKFASVEEKRKLCVI